MEDYIDSYYASTRSAGNRRESLGGRMVAQVCVIGGGLAGLSTALDLAKLGAEVVLLESRRVGWGASGRNGGMVGSGFSLGVSKLVAKLGMPDARALFDLSRVGAETVRRRIAEYDALGMQGVAMGDGIIGATLFDEEDTLRRDAEYMANHFDEQLEFWPKERLREAVLSDRYQAALVNHRRFMIHPLNYCRALANAVEAAGGCIFEGTPVTALTREGAAHLVRATGGEVRAETVVVACGGYIERLLLALARAIVPVATYVIATEPLGEDRLRSAIKLDLGVSDNRLANDYYRPLPDTRILWGGRMTVRRGRPANLSQLLLADLVSIYPQLKGVRVESAWQGLMSYPAHKMPQLGELVPGLWYAMGFGGHGLNTTTMAGRLLADAICDGDDHYRLLAPFGLQPTGGAIGAGAAQLTYWYYQMVDAWRARGGGRPGGAR